MPKLLEIRRPLKPLISKVDLPASKSLSNRYAILEALSKNLVKVSGHSDAEDTVRLQQIIGDLPSNADAGAGGTTFRFALAYLSSTEGYAGILSGTDRLRERPVVPLVEALRSIGAEIDYIEKENFPPLKIQGKKLMGGRIKLSGELSSQFLTAIILIAPSMKSGLEIDTEGKISSRPYLDMTLSIMNQCGFPASEKDGIIQVEPGEWKPGHYVVEKDWSSASYWYSFCLLAENSDIFMPGLSLNSLQGDSRTAELYAKLGIQTLSDSRGIRLMKNKSDCSYFEYNFENQPDIAQTLAVSISAMGISGRLMGLHSLRRKETDRITALRNELIKLGVKTDEPEEGTLTIDASGINFSNDLLVETYEDHRMAMAFAPISLKVPGLLIQKPEVVNKSYPGFWIELEKAGFTLNWK